MLPMSYFVLQPCDVVARVMTSSITVLPPSIHAVASFRSPRPVISPYISEAPCTWGSSDESTASYEPVGLESHHRFNAVSASDCRLRQSADQVTWYNAEDTTFSDDVIGHRPVAFNRESGFLDNDSSSGNGHCRDVTSGSGCVGDENKDCGRQLHPLYCTVCRVRLNGGLQAEQHFEGRTHARRVRLTSTASRFTDSAHQVSITRSQRTATKHSRETLLQNNVNHARKSVCSGSENLTTLPNVTYM